MILEEKEMILLVTGLGIIMYSPKYAEHIAEGEDYLTRNYYSENDIQSHVQSGTIVGFGTGSPGTYILKFLNGYPTHEFLQNCDFKLRLGINCSGGIICVRDLYELLEWSADCPPSQILSLEDGIYHITLCSSKPSNGLIGDNQTIYIYLQELESFPNLAKEGVPTLCM